MRYFVAVIALSGLAYPQASHSAYRVLNRAKYFADLYNWRAASPLFGEAERLFWQTGDSRNAMYAHVGVLRLALHPSILAKSQQLADLLNRDRLFLEDKELRLFTLTVKGDFDGEVDQAAARQDWTQAKNLAKELGNAKWVYRSEGQLGFADYYDGDLVSCQRRVASALIAATKSGDIGAQIFFLSTMANGYLLQKFLQQEAIDYATKAIAIAAAHPDAGAPKIANYVLVQALANTGKVSQAKQLCGRLLANPNLDYSERFNYLSSAGIVAMKEKNYAEGVRDFKRAIGIAQSAGALREIADLQSVLSGIYLSLGDSATAEDLARKAVASLERFGVVPFLPAKLDSLAQVLTAQRKYAEADAIYERAAVLQDTLIGKADSIAVKTALITGAGQLYAHHFALIADHFNDPDRAYNTVEQGRGRAIVDLLLSGGSASPQAVAVERQIAKLRLQLSSLQSRAELEQQRDAIFLAEQGRAVNPDLTILGTKQFRPIPMRFVQKSLDSSELLLEYVLSEPHSYVLALTSDTADIYQLPSRTKIEKSFINYRTALQARLDSAQQAHDLYDTLLLPVPGVERKSHYVIVPDGFVNFLPFDALVGPDGRYVLESHVVTYVPSSTTLYLLRSRAFIGKRSAALLAVGGVPYGQSGIKEVAAERGYVRNSEFGELPNSAIEAETATAAIRNPANEELIGSAATEANVKSALRHQFGYIHLAVHAFSSDNPDRASLVLLSDPSKGEDGFLQASEIVQMRLPAKVVVLSACDTDVGPLEGEEGISSLSTAFLLAGARTVVSTLWSVEDQPSLILMREFYRHLSQGEPAADSMAKAKRAVLSKYGSKSPPIHWAGFVVQGSNAMDAASRTGSVSSN